MNFCKKKIKLPQTFLKLIFKFPSPVPPLPLLFQPVPPLRLLSQPVPPLRLLLQPVAPVPPEQS